MRRAASALLALVALAPSLRAQTASHDSLTLGSLQATALARDPRTRQLDLLATQSALRLRDLSAERRPALSLESQAQYQSDVARLPVRVPGGASPPSPPHDTYDAHLSARQLLYDPALGARRGVERAQLAESRSRVRTAVYALRQSVSDAFFTALRAQTQAAELATTVADLDAQIGVAESRVREGTALPSEVLVLRAELLRRRQAIGEWNASRRAALEVLADLTGAPVDSAAPVATPRLAAAVARARSAVDSQRARPEYELFARARDLLAAQERARGARDAPRVSAFGRTGYGQPGLNPLNDSFDSYWLAGVQLQWSPWTWGTTNRDREVLALQRQIVLTEEAAFSASLRRQVALDFATIDRLEAALRADDEIVDLRERILTETRARFAEAAVTSAEYVDRQTDLLGATIARAAHRVELAQASERVLTTLGIEVR